MAGMELDFFPTTVLRVDAIGKPGERVFYIQGGDNERMVTLVLEKFQLQALVVGVEQLLAELDTRFPALAQSEGDYSEEQMRITGAYDTFFRVGEINLGYDAPADKVALTLESIRMGLRSRTGSGFGVNALKWLRWRSGRGWLSRRAGQPGHRITSPSNHQTSFPPAITGINTKESVPA